MLLKKSKIRQKADSPYVFNAIGTRWQIEINDNISTWQKNTLIKKAKKRIELFDKTYSRFRIDSLIWKMSLKKGKYNLPSDALPLLKLYDKLYQLTGGLFTPLVGQLLADAGYDKNYSLQSKKLSKPAAWDQVISYSDSALTLKEPALLDFGAAGKGYIVDIIAKSFDDNGLKDYCIDASGDILAKNKKSLRVGLENPLDTTKVIGVVEIKNQSICGSSGNRRRWSNYHHIINPKTLSSPSQTLAVWVIAENTMIADALATALFFVESEKLDKHFDYNYLILYKDFKILKSQRFHAEIYR